MPKQILQDFRALFLLEFTKKLIENSQTEEVYKLDEVLKGEKRQEQERIREKLAPKIQVLDKETIQKISRTKPFVKVKKILTIPEPRLPPHLQYLKPTQTNAEIELGKINPLIKNPEVRVIECAGPDENITIKGNGGEKTLGIILTNEEIEKIIQTFSNAANMPIENGIFRAVYGNFSISAILSKEVGSRFIIKKLFTPRVF